MGGREVNPRVNPLIPPLRITLKTLKRNQHKIIVPLFGATVLY